MGHKSRHQIKMKIKLKRKAKRAKLTKQGKKPQEFFMGDTWIGPRAVSKDA